MFTSVHAMPVGGGVRPAKARVIHRNVDPNANRPTATTFLNVHIILHLLAAACPAGRDELPSHLCLSTVPPVCVKRLAGTSRPARRRRPRTTRASSTGRP